MEAVLIKVRSIFDYGFCIGVFSLSVFIHPSTRKQRYGLYFFSHTTSVFVVFLVECLVKIFKNIVIFFGSFSGLKGH